MAATVTKKPCLLEQGFFHFQWLFAVFDFGGPCAAERR
jgi:hypothetical protein